MILLSGGAITTALDAPNKGAPADHAMMVHGGW